MLRHRRLEKFHFLHRAWARPDDAHVAFDYVQYLRQLIKAVAAQKPPYSRDSRIVFKFPERFVFLACFFVGREKFCASFSSALTTMVLNFQQMKVRPPCPTRLCA